MLENPMGANPVWLTESLSEVLDLTPGMRVLDLGCGRAISSIFLAQEFGVQVWACDLWIPASENWERIREAGVDGTVFPIHAEAHSLPFAHGFFDAAVCIDAYHYFGTDDLYLSEHLLQLVRPGGSIGMVVPGLASEFEGAAPDHLASQWKDNPEFWSFHSPAWWRRHWERTGPVEVEVADLITDGWRHWLNWDEATLELDCVPEEIASFVPGWIETISADEGRNLGFARLLARVE
ncbi:MAG: SAM-dependent methyltransferase [Solirubrobacteraceae bacterium]